MKLIFKSELASWGTQSVRATHTIYSYYLTKSSQAPLPSSPEVNRNMKKLFAHCHEITTQDLNPTFHNKCNELCQYHIHFISTSLLFIKSHTILEII